MKKTNTQFINAIEPADIEWREGLPFSRQFDDVYFSKANGLDETVYVFLQQNQLKERWLAAKQDFIIAETGFGTGLNFLATCQLWLSITQTQELHFVSVDKHPLRKQDLRQALQLWPDLKKYADELLEHYPVLTPGWHRLHLFDGRVSLTLYFGEIDTFLTTGHFKADAWFLDGFAPSKNKAMWTEQVYQNIAMLSNNDATFATYTAAGHVRRGLQTAGFTVSKAKGYANKRELLFGRLNNQTIKLQTANYFPWFHHTVSQHADKTITVIGAGLAGAFTANTFAQKGYQVTVFESEKAVAQKASGNKQAMIYCRFSAYASPQYDFYHQAYLYSLAQLQKHQQSVFQTGLLDVPYDEKSRIRFQQLQAAKIWPKDIMDFIRPEQATALTGVPIDRDAIYMTQGGYVNPVELCQSLLSHDNIILKTNCHISEIKNSNNQWMLMNSQSEVVHKMPLLVIATAQACQQFELFASIPLKKIRGQVSHVQENKNSKRLQMPICYEGYIAPSQNGLHSIGASFNLHESSETVNRQDDIDNLAKLNRHMPATYQQMSFNESDMISSRVGFRCCSPDYLPIVGPIPDTDFFENNYQGLQHGQLKKNYKHGKFKQGLFLNVAHGSRGVVSAPLSAELLFSYVCHKSVFPLGETSRYALHPARFLIKQIKRR